MENFSMQTFKAAHWNTLNPVAPLRGVHPARTEHDLVLGSWPGVN